jgi:hypothetical protein
LILPDFCSFVPLKLEYRYNEAIAYAEDEGDVILHYSQDDKLILVEILDFRRLVSAEIISELSTP